MANNGHSFIPSFGFEFMRAPGRVREQLAEVVVRVGVARLARERRAVVRVAVVLEQQAEQEVRLHVRRGLALGRESPQQRLALRAAHRLRVEQVDRALQHLLRGLLRGRRRAVARARRRQRQPEQQREARPHHDGSRAAAQTLSCAVILLLLLLYCRPG